MIDIKKLKDTDAHLVGIKFLKDLSYCDCKWLMHKGGHGGQIQCP